jgi:hypothetical protein
MLICVASTAHGVNLPCCHGPRHIRNYFDVSTCNKCVANLRLNFVDWDNWGAGGFRDSKKPGFDQRTNEADCTPILSPHGSFVVASVLGSSLSIDHFVIVSIHPGICWHDRISFRSNCLHNSAGPKATVHAAASLGSLGLCRSHSGSPSRFCGAHRFEDMYRHQSLWYSAFGGTAC